MHNEGTAREQTDRRAVRSDAPSAQSTESLSPWVVKLVEFLDDGVGLPGTRFRFGWDALLGLLIPVVGDWIGAVLSLVLVGVAIRAKLHWTVIAKMFGHVLLDAGLGMLPVVGDAFDFFYKANRRNLSLLNKHLAMRTTAKISQEKPG